MRKNLTQEKRPSKKKDPKEKRPRIKFSKDSKLRRRKEEKMLRNLNN